MEFMGKLEDTGWKVSIALSILLIPASVVFAAYCPKYINEWVQPSFEASKTSMTGAVDAIDASMSANLQLQSERLLSAIAVLTKQRALAANQVSEAHRVSGQNLALGLSTMSQAERMRNARFTYGGEFGQGYSPCYVVANRQVITTVLSNASSEVRHRVSEEIYAAPGRYGDRREVEEKLFTDNQKFCTQNQVDSGICGEVSQNPGASVSVATLFTPTFDTDDLYQAKVAFSNNLFGLPQGTIPEGNAKSLATDSFIREKSKADALISPAMASIKALQMDYTGSTATEFSSGIPIATLFEDEVKRYSGNSDEYLAWSRILTAQNQHGLLIELLKVESLDLAMKGREYEQHERMEAMLANLVAAELNRSEIGDTQASEGQAAVGGITTRPTN